MWQSLERKFDSADIACVIEKIIYLFDDCEKLSSILGKNNLNWLCNELLKEMKVEFPFNWE